MRGHRRGRRLLSPVMGVGLALSVVVAATAGCGGTPDASAQVASAGGAATEDADAADGGDGGKVDVEQAGLDFARCMREHGVDMPDPQSGEGGFVKIGPGAMAGKPMTAAGAIPDDIAQADGACRHFLDDLVQEGGPPMDAEAQDKALEFARCMREHGIDMPDPDFSGGGGGLRIEIGLGAIDPGSETFRDAQEECGDLFGPGGPGGPGEVRAGVASSGAKSSGTKSNGSGS